MKERCYFFNLHETYLCTDKILPLRETPQQIRSGREPCTIQGQFKMATAGQLTPYSSHKEIPARRLLCSEVMLSRMGITFRCQHLCTRAPRPMEGLLELPCACRPRQGSPFCTCSLFSKSYPHTRPAAETLALACHTGNRGH